MYHNYPYHPGGMCPNCGYCPCCGRRNWPGNGPWYGTGGGGGYAGTSGTAYNAESVDIMNFAQNHCGPTDNTVYKDTPPPQGGIAG